MKTFRDWNEKGYQRIVADMMGYTQYVQKQKNEDGTQDADQDKPLNYESGPGMLPLLPAESKGVKGKEIAKAAREIIRSYFQRHYSECSNILIESDSCRL